MNTNFQDIQWSAFKGAKVLIYGGLGFIGRHLTREAVRLGAKVTVIDDLSNSTITFGGEDDFLREIKLVRRSVNYQPVHEHARDAEYIMWACSTQISQVPLDPSADLMTNAGSFAYMLGLVASMKVQRVKRIIYCGSVSVYGQPSTGWIYDDNSFRPGSHYGISKLAGEYYARLYSSAPYHLPITVIRYSNVYGPGQTPTGGRICGVIGRFIHEYLNHGELEIFGGGTDVRDYTYIEDVVTFTLGCSILLCAIGRSFNFGTGIGTDIHDLIRIITDEEKRDPLLSYETPRQIDTVSRRVVLPGAVHVLTKWDKFTPLDQGIRWTMGWYIDFLKTIEDEHDDDHE